MRTRLLLLLTLGCLFNQTASACENLLGILKNAYTSATYVAPSEVDERTSDNLGSLKLEGESPTPIKVGVSHDVICKVWPAHPEWTLVGVVLLRSEDENESEADLDILIADSKTGTVLKRFLQKGMMSSDAFRKSLESFDTANYALTPDANVFGIRIKALAGGHSGYSFAEELSLFTLKDAQLVQVLEGFAVKREVEASAMLVDNAKVGKECGWREEMKSVLIVGKEAHHGLKDITVQQSRVNTKCIVTNRAKEEQRWDKTKSSKATQVLEFDGNSYIAKER
jgi:hypothetical protein